MEGNTRGKRARGYGSIPEISIEKMDVSSDNDSAQRKLVMRKGNQTPIDDAFGQLEWQPDEMCLTDFYEGCCDSRASKSPRMTKNNEPLNRSPGSFHSSAWDWLSDEMIITIFKHLSMKDLRTMTEVCRRMRRLAFDSALPLWRSFSFVDTPVDPARFVMSLHRNPEYLRVIGCTVAVDEDEGEVEPCNGFSAYPRMAHRVRHIDLTQTAISDETFVELLGACPNIESLDIRTTTISDRGLRMIPKLCPDVTSLGLSMMANATDDGVYTAVSGCTKLRNLALSWLNLKQTTLTKMLGKCKHLVNVDLSGCKEELVDEGIRALVESSPGIVTLDISDCYNLTDESMDHIVKNCNSIRTFSLSRCHNITVAGMRELAPKPSLKAVNVFGCYPLVFPHIQEVCGRLEVNKNMLSLVRICPPFV